MIRGCGIVGVVVSRVGEGLVVKDSTADRLSIVVALGDQEIVII